MKNFLIIVLALGLTAAAFMTRPDREEFDRYLATRDQPKTSSTFDRLFEKKSAREPSGDVEFKDFYLWTVVQKDGKTLYTGVFDRWVDNQKIREILPQGGNSDVAPTVATSR
jgi:hypothetical protein